ncbi:exosome complex protein Rrp42 [Candidatus Bathyarchaeota archaeon]|nr:exosome complex protein Rrp42 [Candidatus Bathyarchaeota archaeon]
MSDSVVVNVKKKRIAELLANGKRTDGRGLTEYRQIQIESGVIERAEGSARVRLGQTEVIVGVKIGTGTPFADTPDTGVLTVNAELVPLASPTFEPGPPGEDAVELARVVDRGIRESKAIDLEKLCVEPGKLVFVVFLDLYVLNHDGNLIDASAIAALAALLNTKMFKYTVEDCQIVKKPGYIPLPIINYPIAVTFAKIGDKLILDSGLDEEKVMDARLTMTLDKDGNICAIQKGGGSGFFTRAEISEITKIAQEKTAELRKTVVKN